MVSLAEALGVFWAFQLNHIRQVSETETAVFADILWFFTSLVGDVVTSDKTIWMQTTMVGDESLQRPCLESAIDADVLLAMRPRIESMVSLAESVGMHTA